MGRRLFGCTLTSTLCLGLMALALSACSGPSAQTPPPIATDAVPSSTPLPTTTPTAVSTPTSAPPTAEEIVRQALAAQSAGEIETALSYYSSGGQWILVDLEPRGVLASAPCAPDLLSPLEKLGCIGGDQLNGLMTYLADRHAVLSDTTIRTATTKNRNNTGAVVGETDAVYVEGTLSFDPAGSGTADTAQVLTVYALREGLIRAFATVLLGYGMTPLQMPVELFKTDRTFTLVKDQPVGQTFVSGPETERIVRRFVRHAVGRQNQRSGGFLVVKPPLVDPNELPGGIELRPEIFEPVGHLLDVEQIHLVVGFPR